MKKKLIMLLSILGVLLLISGCATNSTPTGGATAETQTSSVGKVINLGLEGGDYSPKKITVEANKPVTLRNDGSLSGCGLYMVQPELGISANFKKNEDYTFTPTKKGSFDFSCSHGMMKGTIEVV